MTMNIVYFSKGVRGSRCLAHILDAGYDVNVVVGVSKEDSLEELGQQYGFPIIFFDKLNSPITVKGMEENSQNTGGLLRSIGKLLMEKQQGGAQLFMWTKGLIQEIS